jgi:hypothetical protein
MFKQDKFKNAIILFILTALLLLIIIHIIAYYKVHTKISDRGILGIVIISIFLVHRIAVIKREKLIHKFLGNPLEKAEETEFIENSEPYFKQDDKRKKRLIKKIKSRLDNENISGSVFSKNENKIYAERFTANITNIILTLVIISIVIFYRKVLLSYGLIGIGIGMFFGVISAAYLTRNIKELMNTVKIRKQSKLIRRYKNALKQNSNVNIDEIIFLKNWTLTGKVSLCVVYDYRLKPVSFIFIFMKRFFLEGNKKETVNGIYESDQMNFIFRPVDNGLIKKAIQTVNECNYIDEQEKNFTLEILEQKQNLG